MSKAVIEVMKKHMSLEERKRFVENQLGSGFQNIDGITLHYLFCEKVTAHMYYEFYSRFTPEELTLTIDLKEL